MPLPRHSSPPWILEGELPSWDDGFLTLRRLRLSLNDVAFAYDIVTRRALDAVVIAAHYLEDGQRRVVLRAALRPPLWVRDSACDGVLWELPAGLVEPGEAFDEAAVRELFEETGARVTKEALRPLGPPMLPAPALIAETQAFFHVEIDPRALEAPPGDDSPLEKLGVLCALPVREALALCATGSIRDSKTELGLRRLEALS